MIRLTESQNARTKIIRAHDGISKARQTARAPTVVACPEGKLVKSESSARKSKCVGPNVDDNLGRARPSVHFRTTAITPLPTTTRKKMELGMWRAGLQ